MAKKVSDGAIIVWVNDHPDATDGPGFYLIESDDPNDHQNATFVEKVKWVKDSPESPGEVNEPENNQGHWEYIEEGS